MSANNQRLLYNYYIDLRGGFFYEVSTINRQSCIKTGGLVDGKEVKMQVKEGQKVIYSKYAGTQIKLDGVEYIVVRQNDILAIVED